MKKVEMPHYGYILAPISFLISKPTFARTRCLHSFDFFIVIFHKLLVVGKTGYKHL